MNALAPLEEQRTIMHILRSLETPPEESVRETEILQKAFYMSIGFPDECINELIKTRHVCRVKTASGDFIRRTEKG